MQTHIVNDLFAHFIFLASVIQNAIKKICFHFSIEKNYNKPAIITAELFCLVEIQ